MDSLKFYLNADELRENRLKSVYRTVEEIIISKNLKGNTHVWLSEDVFADFPMELFEEGMKENGFRVSYKQRRNIDAMGKEHGETRIMIVEWD